MLSGIKEHSARIKGRAKTFFHQDGSKSDLSTNDAEDTLLQFKGDRKPGLRHRATEPAPPSSKSTQGGGNHGNDSSSDMPTDNLAKSITQVLNENQIGLRNLWGQHNYLPDQRRTKLITKDAIQKALPIATTNLVDYIHNDASKTFSMVLIAIDDHEQRLEAMEAFYFHGLRDSEHLPVPNMAAKDCCEHSWQKSDREKCHSECTASPRGTCNARHLQVYDCFHHSCWNEMRFYIFRSQQPSFALQHFNTKVFQHHKIGDDRVLPFLPREGIEPIAGGFGAVYPAKMLAGYLIDPEGLIDVVSLATNNGVRLTNKFRRIAKRKSILQSKF